MNLAELVRATKGDRSYDDLARESEGSPGRQRWQQIGTKVPRNFPDPPTIRAVARVLHVGEEQVVLAAAESLGLSTNSQLSTVAALLPPSADRLTDKQIAAVVSVVRAMLEPGAAQEPAKIDSSAVGGVRGQEAVKDSDNRSEAG